MLLFNFYLINMLSAVILLTIKEFTKALISSQLGDPLPKRDRRITLNPLAHLEVIGLILITVTGAFGWGKPVETGNIYYKDRRKGVLLTSLVPMFVMLVISVLAFNLASFFQGWTMQFLFQLGHVGAGLFVWNFVPIHPLEGARFLTLFMPPNKVVGLANMEKMLLILLVLIMFMLPNNPITMIPGFIGSWILYMLWI